jgi:hypothetical protein
MAAEIYRIGQRFGAWTLLAKLPVESTNRRWRCRCDCGVVKDVIASNVTRGVSKGCGPCGARKREREKPGVTAIKTLKVAVGDVYRDWTVLEILAVVQRNRLVRCRCACGTVDTVFAASLRNGRSRGCRECVASRRRREKREEDGEGQLQAAPPLV